MGRSVFPVLLVAFLLLTGCSNADSPGEIDPASHSGESSSDALRQGGSRVIENAENLPDSLRDTVFVRVENKTGKAFSETDLTFAGIGGEPEAHYGALEPGEVSSYRRFTEPVMRRLQAATVEAEGETYRHRMYCGNGLTALKSGRYTFGLEFGRGSSKIIVPDLDTQRLASRATTVDSARSTK